MTCEDFQASQVEKWQGHGTPDVDRHASEHLANCASCREEASDLPSVLTLLRQVDDTYEPSATLWNRIEAGLAVTAGPSPMPRPSWWVFKVAAAMLVAAALFAAWQSTQESERVLPQTAAVVRDALGDGAPKLGTRLDVGQRLRLAPGSAALLDLPGAGTVELLGPAELSMREPLAWTLTHGSLTADILPGGRGFRVSTPCAEISVTGTVFRVNASATGTALTVARGVVRIANERGGQSVVEKSRSMARPGAAPSVPTPVEEYALADLRVETSLRRDPHLSIEATDDLTLRFRFTSPHGRLFLSPPATSPTPYYIMNAVDDEGNAFSIRLNDLGGEGKHPVAIDANGELVQEFKVRDVLPHKGTFLVSGLYVSAGPSTGNPEWQGMLESSPILIDVK